VYTAKLYDISVPDDERDLARLRPDAPVIKPGLILLICETGQAPRKLADGVGHFELKLFRGKNFRCVGAQVALHDGTVTMAYPIEDIAFQAMTRGGRPIDAILQGKVRFRDDSAQIGTTLTAVASGAMLASSVLVNKSHALQGIGGATGAVGAIFDFVSIKSQPHADTRAWDNLPDTVHVALLPREVVKAGFDVRFLDAGGNVVETKSMGGPAWTSSNLLWCKTSD
jgi:hypothetical protein